MVSGLFNSSNKVIGVKLTVSDAINESYDDLQKWLTYPTCDMYDCFDKLVNDKNVAVLADRYSFDLLIEYSTPGDEKPSVIRVTDVVRRYNLVIDTSLGCYQNNHFNLITHRLVTSGIANKLTKDVESKFVKPIILQGASKIARAITLSELQGPFFVLICGFILGFIIFIYEMLSFKR